MRTRSLQVSKATVRGGIVLGDSHVDASLFDNESCAVLQLEDGSSIAVVAALEARVLDTPPCGTLRAFEVSVRLIHAAEHLIVFVLTVRLAPKGCHVNGRLKWHGLVVGQVDDDDRSLRLTDLLLAKQVAAVERYATVKHGALYVQLVRARHTVDESEFSGVLMLVSGQVRWLRVLAPVRFEIVHTSDVLHIDVVHYGAEVVVEDSAMLNSEPHPWQVDELEESGSTLALVVFER